MKLRFHISEMVQHEVVIRVPAGTDPDNVSEELRHRALSKRCDKTTVSSDCVEIEHVEVVE